MKSYLNQAKLLIFSLVLMLSCNSINEKITYRRFAFALPNTTLPTDQFITNQEKLGFSFFSLKEKTFLVIDAPNSYNYEKLKNVLKVEYQQIYFFN